MQAVAERPAESVAPAAALTAALGLFVAGHASRGYRRHDSRPRLALAIGITFLTAIAFATPSAIPSLLGRVEEESTRARPPRPVHGPSESNRSHRASSTIG